MQREYRDGRRQVVVGHIVSAQLSLPFLGHAEPCPGSRMGRVRSYRELRTKALTALTLSLAA
jgi:hypothetical protein